MGEYFHPSYTLGAANVIKCFLLLVKLHIYVTFIDYVSPEPKRYWAQHPIPGPGDS